MRTTLRIDDDVLQAARGLARARGCSLGQAISELARRGLGPCRERQRTRDGFPVFSVPEDAPPITDEDVAAALGDDPDRRHRVRVIPG